MNSSSDNIFSNNSQQIGSSVDIGNSNDSLLNIFDCKSSANQLSADRFESYLHQTILPIAQTALRKFGNYPDFSSKINLIFGDEFSLQPDKSRDLIDRLSQGNVIPIEILLLGQLQIKDAIGSQADFGALVASGKDWRNLLLAKEMFAAVAQDKTPPELSLSLFKDTGASNSNRVTSDETIEGKVIDANSIGKFQAKLNNSAYIDVLAKLNTDGSFSLDKATLMQLNGGQLPDGVYQLSLKAEDNSGNATAEVKLDFTLDMSPPTLGFMLDSLFDSAPIGDSRTTFATVELLGQAEANATVTIKETGASLTADAQGKFKFSNVALILGDNSFTINTIDLAGNTRSQTGKIQRIDKGNSDVILDWNAHLLNAIYTDRTAPPVASRNMAIVHSAVFDAVNSFAKTYKNYHLNGEM